jgi:hypothetical protein
MLKKHGDLDKLLGNVKKESETTVSLEVLKIRLCELSLDIATLLGVSNDKEILDNLKKDYPNLHFDTFRYALKNILEDMVGHTSIVMAISNGGKIVKFPSSLILHHYEQMWLGKLESFPKDPNSQPMRQVRMSR